jgi:hypothetical protein
VTDGPGSADREPGADDGARPADPDEAPASPPSDDPTPTAESETPADSPTTEIEPPAEPETVPAVESTRRLLGASFDLLTRTSDDMRRASFYIGLIVLGTVGPLALASFGLEIVSIHHTRVEMDRMVDGALGSTYALLLSLAGLGLFVASVESQVMAASILGGRLSGRPVTTRAALARSRMVFWRVVIGAIVVGIPVGIAQVIIEGILVAMAGTETDLSIVSSVIAAALVGAPLAYVLAARRSFRVYRARRTAAVLVAVFQTIALVLVILGVSAGLDVALRVFDALGLGLDSGPAGQILIVIGIVAAVFALGTLIYTALAISLAPQVVMFAGLTRATFGLDHVRPGGDSDPLIPRPGRRRFRWLTRPMLAGFALGVLGLLLFIGAANP